VQFDDELPILHSPSIDLNKTFSSSGGEPLETTELDTNRKKSSRRSLCLEEKLDTRPIFPPKMLMTPPQVCISSLHFSNVVSPARLPNLRDNVNQSMMIEKGKRLHYLRNQGSFSVIESGTSVLSGNAFDHKYSHAEKFKKVKRMSPGTRKRLNIDNCSSQLIESNPNSERKVTSQPNYYHSFSKVATYRGATPNIARKLKPLL